MIDTCASEALTETNVSTHQLIRITDRCKSCCSCICPDVHEMAAKILREISHIKEQLVVLAALQQQVPPDNQFVNWADILALLKSLLELFDLMK